MKRFLILLFFMGLAVDSFALSPQGPDYIIYKNDTIQTYNLLIEEYLQKTKDDQGRLFNLSFRNSIDGSSGNSFNCWRGYQAIYEIRNDSLFVNAIIDCHSLDNENQISKNYIHKIFGSKVHNNSVFVDWYSGNISFPIKSKANKILRWDGVFERVFLHETMITIEKGNIVDIDNLQNYIDLEKGINRIEKGSINSILFNQIKKFKWTDSNKIDCGQKYSIVIGKKGKVTDVIMPEYTTEGFIETYWDSKREYKYCIKSMKKALSKLQFDILKRKGKAIEEKFIIEIWFEDDGTIKNWTY
ncbi:hypothetical protein [uncultured Tenacibaculum sp.]|uniref:hypothetical protein n=1 Tax=uncultured Tenacibaculum sp. TaxID=174713 RepID=UPI0026177809|nr:hypothetical protein [uncultured Tenacibaculum sp.]